MEGIHNVEGPKSLLGPWASGFPGAGITTVGQGITTNVTGLYQPTSISYTASEIK